MPEHRSDVQIDPSRCPRRAEIRVTSLSSVRMRRCRSREAKVAGIMLGRSLRVADRTGCRLSGQGLAPCLRRRIRGTVDRRHWRKILADRSGRRGLPMGLCGRTTCDSARHDEGRLTPGHAVPDRLTERLRDVPRAEAETGSPSYGPSRDPSHLVSSNRLTRLARRELPDSSGSRWPATPPPFEGMRHEEHSDGRNGPGPCGMGHRPCPGAESAAYHRRSVRSLLRTSGRPHLRENVPGGPQPLRPDPLETSRCAVLRQAAMEGLNDGAPDPIPSR
jgi:hypothetical protein